MFCPTSLARPLPIIGLKTLNPKSMVPSRLLSIRLLHPALPLHRILLASSVSSRPRVFSVGAGAGQRKSLVDEEAELSDWVTGIKMESSFRPGLGDGGRRQRDRRRANSDGDFGSPFDGRNVKGRGEKRSFLGSDLDDSEEESYGGGGGRRGARGGRSSGRREVGRGRGGFGMERRAVRNGRKGSHLRSTEEVGNVDPRFASGRMGGRRIERGRERKRGSFESTGDDEDEDDGFGFAGKVAGGRGRRFDATQRKGFDKKGVSFDSTEEDEGDVAGVRGWVFDTKQRKGFDKKGVSFQSTEEEDDDDELVSEGEEEFEENNVAGYKEAMAGVNLEKRERSLEGKHDSYLSDSRFDGCPLSPLSLKGVKAAGYERMTVVQEATLPVILKGKDVLAKARTGTGKTVAFLLPAIEIVAKQPPVDRDQRRPPIYVLVICPTRELANQAAMEAGKLLKFHPYIGAQCVTGGTRIALEQKRMQANPCQILVATPGRLRDHIENTAGFATRLRGVQVLVLDEADHLLDMGFRKDIEKIIAAVPKQRQTLLFSATVPEEVRQICHIALRRDHEYINTVEEGSEDTHSQVRQNFLIVPLENQFCMLYRLLADHIADDIDYKVLVFCTTAMVTKLVAGFLSEMKLKVREIHSRKSQSYRAKVSDEFRKSKGLILVTSDVSARGVDYPDVTLVIQVGIPSDREQYIHRLGRTGRTGKEGQGILMLAPWEEYFLSVIRDLPIAEFRSPSVDPDTTRKVQHALAYVEMKEKESAYQSWLGYYNSNKTIGRDKSLLVSLANEFSRSMGLEKPPALRKVILGKMGLRNVPGLRSI